MEHWSGHWGAPGAGAFHRGAGSDSNLALTQAPFHRGAGSDSNLALTQARDPTETLAQTPSMALTLTRNLALAPLMPVVLQPVVALTLITTLALTLGLAIAESLPAGGHQHCRHGHEWGSHHRGPAEHRDSGPPQPCPTPVPPVPVLHLCYICASACTCAYVSPYLHADPVPKVCLFSPFVLASTLVVV